MTYEEALAAVEGIEGWLSDDQARRLYEAARVVPPPGQIVEIGSYRGRSAVVMARAAAQGVEVVAIDPHAGNDRGPQQIRGTAEEGQSDHEQFLANLARGGVADRVRHVRLQSQAALGSVEGSIDVLYVDGAHRYGPARDDIARWGERVRPGGTLLIHDSFSSIGVTLAILRLLVASREYEYLGRSRSLAEYRRTRPSGRARRRSVLRQLAQLGWFGRNLLIKAATVLRLRKGAWPH